MKKRFVLLILFFFICCFIPNHEYHELNELRMIESITIMCQDSMIQLSMKEVIPKRGDNGIYYSYKEYSAEGNNLLELKEKIEKKEKKRFYYRGVKKIITNCNSIDITLTFPVHKNLIQYKNKT